MAKAILKHDDKTVTSCSAGGVVIERNKDGEFHVDPAHALALTSHGFVIVGTDDPELKAASEKAAAEAEEHKKRLEDEAAAKLAAEAAAKAEADAAKPAKKG